MELIQLYAWAETRALQGQCQMEVKLHECHSKKEKKAAQASWNDGSSWVNYQIYKLPTRSFVVT